MIVEHSPAETLKKCLLAKSTSHDVGSMKLSTSACRVLRCLRLTVVNNFQNTKQGMKGGEFQHVRKMLAQSRK